MKRLAAVCLIILMLTGCGKNDSELKRATSLREKLLKCTSCSFRAGVNANYGDKTYDFVMDCSADRNGNLTFTVVEPESIAGIQGSFSSEGGRLTFDDQVLAFPKLADGELSPVSAPWLIVKTLLSGYLTSCGTDSNGLRVTIDDSYEEDALQMDIWLNESDFPFYAEILWQGRRILAVNVENFIIV